MSGNESWLERFPWVGGTITGIGTWISGYVLTYAIVAPDIRGTFLHQVIENFRGDPATYEMVGWVFFNAHFVNTMFSNIPIIGGQSTAFIGSEDGFTGLLYVIPIGLLLAAGVGIARYKGVNTVNAGAVVAASALPGYLLAALASLFLFEVTVGEVTGAPVTTPGIILAGIIYPVIFAGAGGAFAGVTAE